MATTQEAKAAAVQAVAQYEQSIRTLDDLLAKAQKANNQDAVKQLTAAIADHKNRLGKLKIMVS